MADDDDDSGLSAAVDHLLEMGPTQAAGGARPEQLALLPSAIEPGTQAGGPGRPKGSVNKRTLDWAAYINARYPSPLLFLAEAYSRPVKQLADELAIDKGKAFLIQLAAAEKLAPYVAQKQPMAVQVSAAGEVTLVIATSPIGAVGEVVDGVSFEVEDEQNQQVGEG